MPKTLFILNDPPYRTERSYNGLRLAGSLSTRNGEKVRVFLLGDAASCAKKDQKVPQGYELAAVGGSDAGVLVGTQPSRTREKKSAEEKR